MYPLSPASGERVGVRGLSEPTFPHPNPLPEGEGTLSQQHCSPASGERVRVWETRHGKHHPPHGLP